MSARTKLYVAAFVVLILGVWWSPTKGIAQATSISSSRPEEIAPQNGENKRREPNLTRSRGDAGEHAEKSF